MSFLEESGTDHSPLPVKSKHRYIYSYECFMKWRNKRNESSLGEEVFLAYFTELAKAQKPSTLWAQYSMLKATMRVKHHVLIQNYAKLLLFLKKCAVGYKSQKSEILTEDHILQFLNEAPDEKYLATKVALIMGVGGAFKCCELTDLTVNDISTQGDLMLVRMSQNRKMFIVRDDFVPVVKKYQALRPKNMPTDRFFVNYRAGQCTRQVIGKNKFSALPKQIATYLKLPNPERYTGHCFRRSAPDSITGYNTVGRPVQVGPLDTLNLNREATSIGEAENSNFEVDVKVEGLDVFEEETWLINEFQVPMVSDNNLPRNPQPSVSDQHSHVMHNGEEIETIDMSAIKENDQSENEKQEINMAGNNIKISFINCANITLNFK